MQEAIDRLRERFRARAAEDLAALQGWSGDLPAHADELRRLAHRLAGSAGTFGFHALSGLAADAENALITGRPERRDSLAVLADELRRVSGDPLRP